MRFLFISFFLISLLSSLGCSPHAYSIPYHDTMINVDGKDKDSAWSLCNTYATFHNPWDSIPDQGTQFKSFYNDEYLYFHFSVMDSMVYCNDDKKNDQAVEYSDRVELFFAIDSTMSQYCGLEFDACGRKIQFFSNGYRQFVKDWKFPLLSEEDYQTIENNDGYEVEGRLSIQVLKEMGMISSDELNLGVFRADRYSKTKKDKIRWISWKHINTPTPDFHTFEGFRSVKLKSKSSNDK